MAVEVDTNAGWVDNVFEESNVSPSFILKRETYGSNLEVFYEENESGAEISSLDAHPSVTVVSTSYQNGGLSEENRSSTERVSGSRSSSGSASSPGLKPNGGAQIGECSCPRGSVFWLSVIFIDMHIFCFHRVFYVNTAR